MMDLSEVIEDPEFTTSFQVQRFGAGAYANEGVFTVPIPDRLLMSGIVQPASGNDLLRFLPEGERASASIRVYCTRELIMGDGVKTLSDIIIWNGGQYRVAFRKQWSQFGYWFVIACSFVSEVPA